jgi:hypothetical protein
VGGKKHFIVGKERECCFVRRPQVSLACPFDKSNVNVRLRVFEKRVLRRLFVPKRDEVTGGWRKLRNEELHRLYSSPSIIRMIKSIGMRWRRNAARMGARRNTNRILGGETRAKRPLGRPRCRWVDNIKMDLRWDKVSKLVS